MWAKREPAGSVRGQFVGKSVEVEVRLLATYPKKKLPAAKGL
jgi:hypothetical protein